MRAIHIYQGRSGRESPDPARCCADVWPRDGSWHSTQCLRKPTAQAEVRGVTYGFCRQHHPDAVQAREKERERLDQAERAVWERKAQTAAAFKACRLALMEIRDGHNDPRILAAETLRLFPDQTGAES